MHFFHIIILQHNFYEYSLTKTIHSITIRVNVQWYKYHLLYKLLQEIYTMFIYFLLLYIFNDYYF